MTVTTSSAAADPIERPAKDQRAGVMATLEHRGRAYQVPVGLFINNKFVRSASGKMFPAVNPVTGKAALDFFEGDKADIDAAVRAAKAAFGPWRSVPPSERGNLLRKLADLMERDTQGLAELESFGSGKPVKMAAAGDVPLSVACLRYYSGWADKNTGQVIDLGPNTHSFTRHEPFGVCGAIIPWNFPILMLMWKLGPAIACGNTMVVKTSEKTPMTALKVAQLIVEAGFPPGVINIVSGYGPTAGNALARHNDVSKIGFTGSTATGRLIAMAAAETNLKKVSLELGGKSPNIVFPDADLDQAVQMSSMGIFFNAGQCCCAGSRVYVHEDIYDAFIERFRERTRKIKVGDPFDNATDQGPLVDNIQFDRVMGYIDAARADGACIDTGGSRVGNQGYFVAPTLITDVKDDMRIAQEEVFGPVVVVLKFKDMDDIIKRANKSIYGLAAGVHTRDIRTAMRMSRELDAGTVWVNCYNSFHAQMPFGGFKQSGVGRELGQYALAEYTQVKSVVVNLA